MLALSHRKVGRMLLRLKETPRKSVIDYPDDGSGGLDIPVDLCGLFSSEPTPGSRKSSEKA